MANTTWNASDKTANVTLSGTNSLTATSTGSSGGVRTIDRRSTGKYYFEFTLSTWANTQTGVGIANVNPVLSSVSSSTWAGACAVQRSGGIFVNGAAASGSPTLGTRAAGDIIGVAIDDDAKLAWFRVSPSGNWNGNAGFSPGGTGGVSFAAISPDSRLLPVYPLFAFVGAGDVVTANFGDSAFSGAVPSTFTSGFPQNVPPLYAADTQTALEQWAQPFPQAQLTQVAIEQWGLSGAVGTQAIATQVSLEEWAKIAAIVAARSKARVMILA